MIWFWSVLFGVVVAASIMTDVWMYLLQGLAGLTYVALTFSNPLAGLFIWVLSGPTVAPYVDVKLPGPDISFERVAVGMVIVTLLLQVVINRRRLLPASAIEKSMLLFIGVLIADLYIRSSNLASESLITFDTYGTPFLLFFAVKNLVATQRDGRRLYVVLLCLGVYLSVWGVYQYATFSGEHTTEGEVDTEIIAGVEQEREVYGQSMHGRAVGPFFDSIQYGTVVGICFLWSFFLALYLLRGMARFWVATAVLLMGLGMVISLQRSVWLGFVLAIVVVAAMQKPLRRMIVLGFFATSLVAIGATFAFLDFRRLEDRLVDMYSVYQRVIMYQTALSMSLDSPIVGYGQGKRAFVRHRIDYVSSIGSISADYGLEAGPPHNQFLFTQLQWGVLGLVPYVAIFYLLMASCFEIRRMRPDPRSVPHCMAAFFVATTALYITQGMLMDVAELKYLASLYFILGGYLEGTRQRLRAAQPAPQAARAGSH